MTILSEIVGVVEKVVEDEKKIRPVDEMDLDFASGRSIRDSIKKQSNVPVIGELKRASPSMGRIRSDFQASEMAISMAEGGATAISVLTESNYFDGELDYLVEVKESVKLPVLRKDFIIDEYQLYQSAEKNADAVLLIAEVLGDKLTPFVEKARELGLETLVEVRDRDQVELAVSSGTDLIGVNNRDLRTMRVDLSSTERLAKYVPEDFVLVSESGIRNRSDVEKVMEAGADAVLVGTSIMTSGNIEEKVRELVFGD